MSIKAACLKNKSLLEKSILLMLFLLVPFVWVQAQGPKVPAVIEFAGMKLKISEQARKDIQSDVDALYRSEKYFNIKVERVDLYFPIIERILKEEGVPQDFKYLIIQESSLISDAISTSNAVGFWQFKQDSGEEVGLKINAHVDERMNIVASTRGAATYLKKHNSYFDNWVYSLLAYYLGRGGAKSVAEPKLFGADKMDIDKNTNWYILKFLAHKIAFEGALGKNPNPPLILAEYTDSADKTLREIGIETEVDLSLLEHYNKWLKMGSVPTDKIYSVILPIVPAKGGDLLVVNEDQPKKEQVLPGERVGLRSGDHYPKIEGDVSNTHEPLLVTLNGRPGIISRQGDDIAKMAAYGGLKEERFKRINDLKPGHKVKEGQYYYFKPKRNNAPVHYHTVQSVESIWDIAQMYGIRQNNILKKNRMSNTGSIQPGMVLWLRYIRPANEAITYRKVASSGSNAAKKPDQGVEQILEISKEQTSSLPNRKEASNKPEAKPEAKSKENPIEKEAKVEQGSKAGPAGTPQRNESEEQVQEKGLEVRANENVEQPAIKDSVQQETSSQNISSVQKPEKEAFEIDKVTFIETEKKEEENRKAETHVVKQGETLYGIARQYGIPLQDLANWNELKYDESIKIGQTILVNSPIKITSKDAPDVRNIQEKVQERVILHKVSSGETLYKIAREHNVTIKEVMEWNGKTDFNVALGEVIKIKKLIGNE